MFPHGVQYSLRKILNCLKYYYNDGPAYNITSEMTQPLFADLFAKIDEIETSPEANVSILNFAHSETLQPFMTALGCTETRRIF